MKTQYANINAYNGQGDYKIIFDDEAKKEPYRVYHRYWDYGLLRWRTVQIGRYNDMQSALFSVAGLL